MIDIDELIAEASERCGYMTILAKMTDSGPGKSVAQADADRMSRFADGLIEVKAERDAALARIAKLEQQYRVMNGLYRVECNERAKAEARIAEAAKLHRGYVNADGSRTEWCSACGNRLPCDTRRALGLNEGENGES